MADIHHYGKLTQETAITCQILLKAIVCCTYQMTPRQHCKQPILWMCDVLTTV